MLWDAVKNGERSGGGPEYRTFRPDSTASQSCSPATNGDQACGLVRVGAVGKIAWDYFHTCNVDCRCVDTSGQIAQMPIKPGPKLWTVNAVAPRIMLRP